MTEELDIIHDIVAFCSDEVQGFIYSDSWKRDLETTARKFNIKSEKYPALENEVVFVLTGLVPIEKFIDYTKRELGLDQNVATWLADEVRKTIFSKVKIEEFDLERRSRELGLGGGASSGEDSGDGGGDESDTIEADVAEASIVATAGATEQAIAELPTSAPLETIAPSAGSATGSATADEDEKLSDYESVIMGQASAMQEALDVVPPSQAAKVQQVENKPPEIVGLGSIHAFDATVFTPSTVGLSDLLKMDSSKPEAKKEDKVSPLTMLEPSPPAQQDVPIVQGPVVTTSDAGGSPLVGTHGVGAAREGLEESSPPSPQSSPPPTPPATPLASAQAPADSTPSASEPVVQAPPPASTARVIHNYVGPDPYREAPE